VALGFALANGASSLTADIISGLFLSRDRDFECGYRIKVGDIEGTIERVDTRKIRIKSDDGRTHVFPSSKVDTMGWTVVEKK
jgi:small-conductance mechanosensitive channel